MITFCCESIFNKELETENSKVKATLRSKQDKVILEKTSCELFYRKMAIFTEYQSVLKSLTNDSAQKMDFDMNSSVIYEILPFEELLI